MFKTARKLLDWVQGSPSPQKYDTRMEMVYSYELELLRLAAFNKGARADAQQRLKSFNAWRLREGK